MEASTTGKESTIHVHVEASCNNDNDDDDENKHSDMVDNKSKINSGAASLSAAASKMHHPPQQHDHDEDDGVVFESNSTPKTNAKTTTATTTPSPRRRDVVAVVRRNHWPEEHVHQDDQKDDDENIVAKQQLRCCLLEWIFIEYQKWTYSYMNPILQKGSRQQQSQPQQDDDEDGEDNREDTLLQLDDLYRVPSSMKSDALVTKFEERYYNNSNPETTQSNSTNGGRKQKHKHTHKNHRLLQTLWYLSKPTFVPGGICQLVAVICQLSMPLFVQQLLLVLETNPSSNILWKGGLTYTLGIFCTMFVNAFMNHRHRHLAMKTGIILRSCLVGVIYRHVLKLLPKGKRGLTSGEVNTLVAIDAQKLFEVTQEAHLIWSMPLSMTLVTVCLLTILGPSMLVGLCVLLVSVPTMERIAAKIQSIRHQRAKVTDRRVEIINSMLLGIKVTKLNNYEEKYRQRIEKTRKEEHDLLKSELSFWATSLLMQAITPVMASAASFATYVTVQESHILTPAQTFTVLLFFSALRFPIAYFGRLVGKAALAMEAIRRLELFINRPVRDDIGDTKVKEDEEEVVGHDDSTSSCFVLSVKNGSFFIDTGSSEKEIVRNPESPVGPLGVSDLPGFSTTDVNFTLQRGKVLALVGPVGAGKSTIINGIIGEVASVSGTKISMNGRVSYVSQTPFILNATVRDNILFELEYDEEWYNQVLDACCLRQDLEQLGGAGDMTEIGERGVNLSGGQKQRISLARAAYAKPDLILMDDPISALDAGTAKRVFDRLIQPSTSILSNSAIVLVTHAAHFLNRVDTIMVVVDGKAQFIGTWNELSQYEPQNPKAKTAIDYIRSSVQEGAHDEESVSQGSSTSNHKDKEGGASKKKVGSGSLSDGKLITVEEREHGISSLSTWYLWFKHAGGAPFMLTLVVLMALDKIAYFAGEYWLARWTQGAFEPVNVFGWEFPAQVDGRTAQFEYLKVYAIIIFSLVVFTFLRSEWSVIGGFRCAEKVFLSMLSSVLLAPISYFETTPLGRILNRFTYDTEVVDVTLTEAMSILMLALGWFITGIVVMVSLLPWIVLALVPATTVYWFLSIHYRKSGTDLQRLDAVARSPIQALLSEGLEGSTTIRMFGQAGTFVDKFHSVVDESGSALLNFVSAQRWLGLRIEIIGSSIVLCCCMLVISLNDKLKIDPGLVALLIMWASGFTITLGFLVDYFAEGEAAITSIERVDAMVAIEPEKPMSSPPSNQPKQVWPENGNLQFDQVTLRYRKGLPTALSDLSFNIPSGARCGVVGRTGAGKSSLSVALFRLVELEAGRIYLDGVDLAQLGLADVRGRLNGMAIIPQDPFIAGTTLRESLDPFGCSNDREILEALVAVRLADSSSTTAILDDPLSEGGVNYSVGERQLLNMARALLSKPKVLVLDEATASIDGETDAFIQEMLRTRFKDTTLVTVAHRLNTIMDYDLILVMDNGSAAEFGSPKELLEKGGIFASLVDSTGAESSLALRDIAARSGVST